MFTQDFEFDTWSRFRRRNLINICVYTVYKEHSGTNLWIFEKVRKLNNLLIISCKSLISLQISGVIKIILFTCIHNRNMQTKVFFRCVKMNAKFFMFCCV